MTTLLKNGTSQAFKGVLRGQIEKAEFSQDVEIGPNEQKDVAFDPAQLHN